MEKSILIGLSAFSTFCGYTSTLCSVYIFIYIIYIFIYIYIFLFTLSNLFTVRHHSLSPPVWKILRFYWCFFFARSNHPTLFRALTQAPLPVSEKFMSCNSWVMGSPLKKIPRGICSASKKFNKQSKIQHKDPQPRRHCRKHDISIKNIPSMCVSVAPGLQSHVAVLVPKRLASWFRQLWSPSAKKWRWNNRKHIREVLQTATYRKNGCIIFLYTYYNSYVYIYIW